MAVYYNGNLCNVWGGGREAFQIYANGKKVWNYHFEGDGNWGACSASCGGGVQYQGAICKRSDGVTKTNNFCNADGVGTPTLSRPCNTHTCTTIDGGSCDILNGGIVTSGDSGEFFTRYTCWNQPVPLTGSRTVSKVSGSYVYFVMTFSWYDVNLNLRMLMTSPGGVSNSPMQVMCTKLLSGQARTFSAADSTTVLLAAPDGNHGEGRVMFRAPLSYIGGSTSGSASWTWTHCDLRSYSGNKCRVHQTKMGVAY